MAQECSRYTSLDDGTPELLFDFIETSQIVFGNIYATGSKEDFTDVLRKYKSDLQNWVRVEEATKSIALIDVILQETNNYFGTVNMRQNLFRSTKNSQRIPKLEQIINTVEKLRYNQYVSREAFERAYRARWAAERELRLIVKLHAETEMESEEYARSRESWEKIKSQLIELNQICIAVST